MPPREADLANLLTDGLGIVVDLLLAQGIRRVALRFAAPAMPPVRSPSAPPITPPVSRPDQLPG